MGIKYAVATGNKSFVRPTGYGFPAGLNVTQASSTSIDYLIVAGGGAGGGNSSGGGGSGGGGAGGLITGTLSLKIGRAHV